MAGEIVNPAAQNHTGGNLLHSQLAFGGNTSGVSTAADATTMTDALASWTTDQWAGKTIFVDGKTGVVVSNTATVATVASWTGGTPTGIATYIIGEADAIGAVGTYNIFDGAAGLHIVRLIGGVCIEDLIGASATISLGTTSQVAQFIAATTATAIDTDEIWQTSTVTKKNEALVAACKDIIITDRYITITIATAPITGGALSIFAITDKLVPTNDEIVAVTGSAITFP